MIHYKFSEGDEVLWTHFDQETKGTVRERAMIVGYVYECELYADIPRYGIQLLDREVVIDAYSGAEKKYLHFPIIEAVEEGNIILTKSSKEEKSVAEVVSEIENTVVAPSGV